MIAKVTRSLPDTIDVPPQGPSGPSDFGGGGGGAGTGGGGLAASPLLHVLWRRRWTVLLVTLACVGAAVLYLLKATPVYTSTSRLLVEQSGPKILTDSDVMASRSSNYLYTQAEVLTSTPIVSTALDASGGRELKTFAGIDNPLAYLKRELRAEVGKKDDVITVSFDSPYPQEAADLVNRVVDAYVNYTSAQKRSTAAEMLKILQKEKQDRDAELTAQVRAMLDFKRKNEALSFSNDKGNIILQRLDGLLRALTDAELETMKAQADYDGAHSVLGDEKATRAFVEARQNKGTSSADQEYTQLRSDLNQQLLALATIGYAGGENNPRAGSVRAAVEMLRRQIAEKERRMVEALLADAEQVLTSAAERQRQVAEAYEAQRKEAMELNAKEAEYQRLESDVKRTEKMCDLLDSRIKEINVNDVESGALNTQVLEVARPEDKPSKPRKPLILAAALMMGLVLGTGLGLARDWMDHRLRSAEDIMASLGLPVLGVVPHMGSDQSLVSRGQSVSLEPMGESAEAYRTVRTALFFGAAGADAKTILVTSPAPGDGKSTSASNLAIAMAQAGHRTLLLDADFRKPTQHRIFELEDDGGLSSVIAGQVPLRDAIRRTNVARLQVLPCGPVPPNPAEILNGRRFAQVMDVLVRAYDRVVIDSPPVMPVTDARILAASADVTVLVLRANKSTHRLSVHARDGLASVGANILGVVVNDVPRRRTGYGYGYGYYGSYGGRQPAGAIEGAVETTDATEVAASHALEGGSEARS